MAHATTTLKIAGPMYASISVPAKMPQNYRALVDVANSTNAVTPQFANLWSHRAISEYMLEAVGSDSNIWLYFDRSKLGEELVRPDEGFRSDGIDVNALGIFSSGAAWVNGYDHVGSLKVRNAYKAD